MMAEPPVVAQQPLGMQLLAETHPSFAKLASAAHCPRRRPRTGQQLGCAPALPTLAFTRFDATYFDASAEGGALLEGKCGASDRPAVCAGHVMRAGRHAADPASVAPLQDRRQLMQTHNIRRVVVHSL